MDAQRIYPRRIPVVGLRGRRVCPPAKIAARGTFENGRHHRTFEVENFVRRKIFGEQARLPLFCWSGSFLPGAVRRGKRHAPSSEKSARLAVD